MTGVLALQPSCFEPLLKFGLILTDRTIVLQNLSLLTIWILILIRPIYLHLKIVDHRLRMLQE